MAALLVVLFIALIAIGVPISFSLGVVSFTGIFALPTDETGSQDATKQHQGMGRIRR